MCVPSPDVVKDKISGLQEDHNFFMRELLSAIKQAQDLRADNQTDLPSRLLSVREIITRVARRLETHNELEESEVYGWIDEMLNEAARADLYAAMLKEIENLPPRFMKLGKPINLYVFLTTKNVCPKTILFREM
jgi:hypothetical protein